ncbi:MAG: hypothetical protein E6Q89_03950 [Bacteroidia bacterium]|nr:MAG: hypothetical protein E6Q89_03950 [Bacteroidia bacterium]
MKKRWLPALVMIALGIVSLYSCTKKNEQYTGDYGRNYFPLTFGKTVTYDVDSTLWDDFFCVKSLHHYQIRWTVSDTFRDNEFRLSYRIDSHIRTADSMPWQTHRVMYVTPTNNSLEMVEENLRFVKLAFPIQNGNTWDGNSKISYVLDEDLRRFDGWHYYYDKYSEPFNDGFVNFENTVTVNQVNDTVNNPEVSPNSFASKTFSKEVYAQGVGMVYRETIYWTYQPAAGGSGTGCRKGYGVIMRAVDHN